MLQRGFFHCRRPDLKPVQTKTAIGPRDPVSRSRWLSFPLFSLSGQLRRYDRMLSSVSTRARSRSSWGAATFSICDASCSLADS